MDEERQETEKSFLDPVENMDGISHCAVCSYGLGANATKECPKPADNINGDTI